MEDLQKLENDRAEKLKEELQKRTLENDKLKDSLAKEQHEKNKKQQDIDVSFILIILITICFISDLEREVEGRA